MFDVFVIGENAVVDHNELVLLVRPLRMAIELRGRAMSCPTGVRYPDVFIVSVIQIEVISLPNRFLQNLDFTRSSDDLYTAVISVEGHSYSAFE